LSYEDGEVDIPDDEHSIRRSRINERLARWQEVVTALDEALTEEISKVWRRIRQLERIAIGTLEIR
jgi:hypothetical protein